MDKDVPEPSLADLAEDVAHPFDQTNGLVDGLSGDEDDPDKVDERLTGDDEADADIVIPPVPPKTSGP